MKRDDMGMRIDKIRELATKYSKPDLQRMVQMGMINPQEAVMAGMMIDRISKSAMKPPETKDPWVVVPGVGVFPRAQLEAAAKQAEANGAPDVTITANIPDGAAEDLKAGRVSKAAFDSVFGAGKADKILGVKK